MPPKTKKNTGKPPKIEKYTTIYSHYKLLTLEENQALALKNFERLSQIESTSMVFQEYDVKINEYKMEQAKIDEWDNYLACDGLPHSYIPCELRTFLHKIAVFEADDFKNSFSWVLTIDERSILTQDVDAKNYTREYLKKNLRRNHGLVYEKFITDLLNVCKRVQKNLATRFLIDSDAQYMDIKMLLIDIQEKIKLMFDMLTFRLLSHENGNLESSSVRTNEYSYKSEHFSLDIWSFKNVPITFDLEEMPSVDVLLKTIQVGITLPFAVLYENLVLRGIFINYDHYSEFSRTFKINSNYEPVEENFKKKLKQEWKQRIAMQKDIKEKMKAERVVFEEYLILKEKEEKEAGKKRSKGGGPPVKKKTKTKSKKSQLEPPIVDVNSYPDIEDDFKKFIEEEHINMQKQFDPKLLQLDENEINLREYFPLGGLYELNYVHKTDQVIFSNIVMKWFLTPIKLRYINKITDEFELTSEEELNLLQRRSRRFSRFGEYVDESRIAHYFEIVFKIPENVTKWSEPIVCQFCLGNDLVDLQKNQEYIKNLSVLNNKNISTTTPIIINDFNISGYLNNEQIYNIIKYALPRTISSYQIAEELLEPKKTGGTGLKKFINVDEDEESEIIQDQDEINMKKELPERLFPNYPKLQPIVILEDLNKNITDDEKYFNDLIIEFQNYQKIKQPYFIVRDLPTKKLKELIALEIKERAKRISSKPAITTHGGKGTGKKNVKKKIDNIDDTATITNEVSQTSEIELPDQLSEENSDEPGTSESEIVTDNLQKNAIQEEFVMGTIRANKIINLDDKTQWSTKHIIETHFNKERSELTVTTDRLGIFAFMFPKFLHFPFKNWLLYPDPENLKENVIFHMVNNAAIFTIKITEKGYFAHIKNFGNLKSVQIYYKNEEPITDLDYLIEEMRLRNLNIFPDADSFVYMKGRFQEKLLAMELHNYNCMAIYSLFMKFAMSEWNWISDPRILIFKAGELRDKEEDFSIIKITPEESSFVEIKELCSPDLNKIVLKYTPTWRNIEYNADLLSLITTSYTGAYNNRLKDAKLYSYISKLLKAIRPLSSC